MNDRVMKKALVLIALLIVLFHSFSLPVLAATTIKPWNGNPWSGQDWSGSDWNPQDFKWEGNPWEGTPWEGQGTKGNDWEGNGTNGSGTNGNGTEGGSWNGSDWESLPWYLDPWIKEGWKPGGFEGSPFEGNGTDGNPFDGNGTNGNPFDGNGTNGNGTNGNPFDGNGTNGNSTNGNGTNGNGTNGNTTDWTFTLGDGSKEFKMNFSGVSDVMGNNTKFASSDEGSSAYSGYSWLKFAVNDVAFPTLKTAFSEEADFDGFRSWNPTSKKFYHNLFQSTFKFAVKDVEMMDVGFDIMSATDKYASVKESIKLIREVPKAKGKAAFITNPKAAWDSLKSVKIADIAKSTSNYTKNIPGEFIAKSPLGKLNVISAGVGAVFSAKDSFNNAVDLYHADTKAEKEKAGAALGQSSGNMLMSLGAGVAAFPGGQVVGGAMVIAGAALWAGSTIYKHRKKVWNAIQNPKETLNKIGESAVKKGKKAWSTVKGWFS
ncbi:hypothetical protein [Rossellomorea marisflavi]|uniref:hypothetical protein n=2 Tax=Rossellomorea marisflavi TaxID=189381 RepID=UPI003514F3BA